MAELGWRRVSKGILGEAACKMIFEEWLNPAAMGSKNKVYPPVGQCERTCGRRRECAKHVWGHSILGWNLAEMSELKPDHAQF